MKNKKIRTFISYRKKDTSFKNLIISFLDSKKYFYDDTLHDYKSNSDKPEKQIIQNIVNNRIKNSSVTIVLVTRSFIIRENKKNKEKNLKWIIREIAASVRDKKDKNLRNGLFFVVSKPAYKLLFKKNFCKDNPKKEIMTFSSKLLIDSITKNSFEPNLSEKCGDCWIESKQYGAFVKWKDFKVNPKDYLTKAIHKSNNKWWDGNVYAKGYKEE